MKSTFDQKISRAGGRKSRPRPAGGKVLQRLVAYLGQRDRVLCEETAASLGFAPRGATRGRGARRRTRPQIPAAKAFATAIRKAATSLTTAERRRPRRAAIARPGSPPAAAAGAWQFIGPMVIPNGQTYGSNRVDVSGRVACIAVNPSNAKQVLVGAAGGGIWRSTDAGATWTPCTDAMPSLAIGAVTFDPTASGRVYAGSGEGNFYSNLGAGVYASNDSGATWSVLASAPFVGVGFYDLIVDPKTPKTLYAATTNGLYRSTDGGAAWTLKRSGACWGISIDRGGGAVEVLATFADGLVRSTNSGSSFAAVTLPSAPPGVWTRLAVDRVNNTPDIAYVFGAIGKTAHLWRRTGTTWTKLTSLPPKLDVEQAWYDWYVAAPPDNTEQVFLGAIDGYRGALSGSSWKWKNITTQGSNSIHPDQHCLAFSPDSSKVVYAGNDGGIFRSRDSGASWTPLNKGLGITEIEYLASKPSTWKWLMGGTQDNGTIRFTGTAWEHIADGDGGDCGVNQLSPDTVYHSYYGVSLERSANSGDTWTALSPPSMAALFYPPVEVSGATVAIGGASLAVTRTAGNSWTTVGLGLASQELASTMKALDANTFAIGTTRGKVLRVAWTGSSWNKTVLASPGARYISCITTDPTNPARLWLTLSQIDGGSVFRSDDGGASWVNCSTGLPKIPMNSVTVDPANYNRAWVAGDVGVYQTLNLGKSWAPFSTGLPNAMAADLLFHKQDRMLVCATRNRGAWAIAVP